MSNLPSESPRESSGWLVLVPTVLERELARASWPAIPPDQCPVNLQICGFGPTIPAAQAVRLISQFQPRQVLLLGIAGTYSEDLPVGQAAQFTHVGCYGIGVGVGSTFRTSNQMGWQQWTGDGNTPAIGDVIALPSRPSVNPMQDAGVDRLLLTTSAASDNARAVRQRLAAFPTAIAEDMEGFAVAVACQLCGVPLFIVRGISNRAGDRHHAHWEIELAVAAAVKLSGQIMAEKT